MKQSKRSWMLYVIFGLPVFVIAFIALVYFGNCGFNNNCPSAEASVQIIHTPIPTLIPATLPVFGSGGGKEAAAAGQCRATAEVLLSAWVSSGHTEKDPFKFTDQNGSNCEAIFKDIQQLFIEGNLWYSGALPCASCHNSDLATASANMDLSSYNGIIAGAKRTSPDAKGTDILGGGNWDQAILRDMLFVKKLMPLGRPPGAVPEGGPTIAAGHPVVAP